VTEPQRRVQALLDQLIDSGAEIGLQVAAYHDGKQVVDAWAGLADVASSRPVDGDSLFTVFSCSKAITATAVHILTERGQVDYDTPVAAYWPEFGAQGKQQVTVRQVLNHTAGIPQLPAGTRPQDLCDWSTICRGLAAERLLWEPGTRMGYHARTYGYILGEVIQRVSGRPFPQVVREEICRPLGITNLYFGIGDAEEPRVATLEPDPNQGGAAPSGLRRLVFPPEIPATAAVFNRPDIRRACIPSSGGIMNARSLARHYAALACGELDGVRLLTPERLRLATELQPLVDDVVQGSRSHRGLGYQLGQKGKPFGARLSVFGHGGTGGATGFADPDYRFAFALTKTQLGTKAKGPGAPILIAQALRAELGIPEGSARRG
jgi:CubicO group peptidase (beta-lactamase class C family)